MNIALSRSHVHRLTGFALRVLTMALALPSHAVPLPPLPDGHSAEYPATMRDYAQTPAMATPTVSPPVPKLVSKPLRASHGRFDFQFVNVAQLVSLLYGEAMKTPYVIAPEVLEDQRVVSFRYDAKSGHLRDFLVTFLDSLGFGVEKRDGVDFVYKRAEGAQTLEAEQEVFVYRPQYRNSHDLSRQAQPLFKGTFTDNRQIESTDPVPAGVKVPPTSAAARIDQHNDAVIFFGAMEEIAKLKRLLPLIDTPSGEVAVKAVAYEVTYSDEMGSAFHAAMKLLGQGVTIGAGGPAVLANVFRLKIKGTEAVFSALAQDSRFKVINEPNLRIRSGAKGKLTIGQKVPVLGAVTYRTSGQPVQSIEYHSSGVIFELRPVVKENVIDVHVSQQISDFVRTDTGVNTSPTLNTREIVTDITVEDGDLILLGGLTTNKNMDSRAGMSFLPRFLDGTSRSHLKTEILLVLHVQKI